MNPIWLLVIAPLCVILLLTWSLCRTSHDADALAERIFEK
jgi:hypothetical protein